MIVRGINKSGVNTSNMHHIYCMAYIPHASHGSVITPWQFFGMPSKRHSPHMPLKALVFLDFLYIEGAKNIFHATYGNQELILSL